MSRLQGSISPLAACLCLVLAYLFNQMVQPSLYTYLALSATCFTFGHMAGFKMYARREAVQSKTLAAWQKQDAKLVAEVQSDKEKQLEAKIATLEAALQRALKK